MVAENLVVGPQNPTAEPYNVYRFNAKRFDPASGDYDMGFRDYDPGLNRFLTRDRYNGALADLDLGLSPWTMNRYGFAGGNPISLIELDGHTPSPDNPVSANPKLNTWLATTWSRQHPARSHDYSGLAEAIAAANAANEAQRGLAPPPVQ